MKKILIVEDAVGNIRLLGDILVKWYEVCVAKNGKEALKLLEKKEVDLILMDVVMPLMDGLECTRQLKKIQKYKDVPVIFITGKNDWEHMQECFEAGGVDYIQKPFQVEEVLIRVKNQLELFESRLKIFELERKNGVLAMAATVNHELNQQLAILSGNMEFLSDIFKDEKEKMPSERVRNSIIKMTEILNKYKGIDFQNLSFEEYLPNVKSLHQVKMIKINE